MTSRTKLTLASALLCICMMDPALANSMRCGTHIITAGSNGPGAYEVLKRCGEPTSRFGKTWTYKRSNSPFANVLYFDSSGTLYKMEKR